MIETPDISPRARATLPRGFADRDAGDLAAAEAMIAKIGEVYALYGFEAVETPFVEYTDALGKFLPDQDRPNEGVFSFKDDDEQWLSLRYDLTAPLARYVAENYDRLPDASASSCSSTPTRSARPRQRRMRKSA
jgi:histidyl-tRNA synthetase